MGKFTLFAVSALLACPAVANAQAKTMHEISSLVKLLTKEVKASNEAMKMSIRKSPAMGIWKATHETEYGYNEDDATWEEEAQYYYTYDTKGNVLTNTGDYGDGSKVVRTNTYNDNSMVVYQTDEEVDEDGTSTLMTKRIIDYDSIVPSVITKREAYSYDADADSWYPGNCYTRTITRNEDGNVTSEVVATLYNGEYDPTQRTTITYKDGKAVTYKLEQLVTADDGGFEWEDAIALKDIVWEKTNGQILGYVSDFYEGENRLKSASLYNIQAEGEEYTYATLSLEYDEKGGYAATMSMPKSYAQVVYSKTYTDENGSYVYEVKQSVDYNMNGKFSKDEVEEYTKQVEQFDAEGNETLYEVYDIADDAESPTDVALTDGTYKTDYQYDEATGEVSEQIVSWYDSELKEYVPTMKVVSDTYVNVADVTAIGSAKATAKNVTAVYNLQGVRVGDSLRDLPSGLYIQKIGGKTTKVVKR